MHVMDSIKQAVMTAFALLALSSVRILCGLWLESLSQAGVPGVWVLEVRGMWLWVCHKHRC